jgi:GNAT superfamily N-acetyltransferase
VTEVRPAKPEDIEALAALLEQMDRFYGATNVEPLEARLRQIREALFADPPTAYAMLAWQDDELLGLATYSFLWPAAGLTRSLFLKELYVATARRHGGVGKLLMQSLFDLAAKQGCSRVEWMTDDVNADAQQFYETQGHRPNSSKVFYRVGGNSADWP